MEIYDLVDKIEKLRKERGWTTYRLAEEAGITQSTIFNMHARGTLPSVTTLYSICNAFGITLAEFFSDDASFDLNDGERELIYKFRKMSFKDKKAVLALANALCDAPDKTDAN